MEFYLVKDELLEFPIEIDLTDSSGTITAKKEQRISNRLTAQLQPVVEAGDECEVGYLQALENALVENTGEWKNFDSVRNIGLGLCVWLTLSSPSSGTDNNIIEVFHHDDDSVDAIDQESILKRLWKLYDQASPVMITVSVRDFIGGLATPVNFKAKDMPIEDFRKEGHSMRKFGCRFDELSLPKELWRPWRKSKHFSGRITIKVALAHDAVSKLHQEGYSKNQLTKRCRSLLNDAVHSDLVLLGENGVGVKCHKAFLAVSSAVFKKMFENDSFGGNKVVVMDNMRENGVRAFLAFIYDWDLQEASKDCEIAVELLRAAHKYEVQELEAAMEGILLAKPNDWFTVGTALKLLIFAKDLNSEAYKETMQKKALQVLLWHSKKSKSTIADSPEFQLLFEKDSKNALEVATLFLSLYD